MKYCTISLSQIPGAQPAAADQQPEFGRACGAFRGKTQMQSSEVWVFYMKIIGFFSMKILEIPIYVSNKIEYNPHVDIYHINCKECYLR